MKTLILLSLIGVYTTQTQAGDLIFRSGSEASGLVSGTATAYYLFSSFKWNSDDVDWSLKP